MLARQLRDPAFRAEWERTAVARAVATRVIAYRAAVELGLIPNQASATARLPR